MDKIFMFTQKCNNGNFKYPFNYFCIAKESNMLPLESPLFKMICHKIPQIYPVNNFSRIMTIKTSNDTYKKCPKFMFINHMNCYLSLQ